MRVSIYSRQAPWFPVVVLAAMLIWPGDGWTAGRRAAAPAPIPAGPATTLKETVSFSLAYSPNVKSFQEYRQAAEHDLQRARSGWFPRVDARAGWGVDQWSGSTSRANENAGRSANTTRDYYSRSEASLTVSQTIWDGLATLNRVKIGKTRLDSAENRLYDNAEGIGLDAVLAHIEVYRQRRIVALAELNVKNHRSILASQFERHKSGAATMADVTQTQSRLARTEASLAESRAALDVAVANYARLTGRDPGLVAPPAAPVDAYPSLEAALLATRTGNLKVRASESDIKTAYAQADLDKSAFHPTITLEAGPSYSYRVQDAPTDSGGMAVMLRASWNLFNGGYDYYNVRGDLGRARQAKQELEGLKDQLSTETQNTWTDYLSAQEQSRHFANAVDYSTKTRNMYLEQFNVGQRSLLDVLDSENELFSYSIQLVTAQLNVIAAQYRILTLGGRLLADMGINRKELNIDIDVAGPDRPNVRK
ncbi:MAG: TolC family outer membrane protein [Desulfovibrio sp.]|nr:TolC family outer membrane protein [Desulfovibrio sp.]